MTLQELYEIIGGDYAQATRVLRMDKLVDKHIRKLTKNGVVDSMLEAGEAKDENRIFETSHAVKGVCGNLGLVKLADIASVITEEFRPGSERKLSDQEIQAKFDEAAELYQATKDGIKRYEEESAT